MSIGQFGPICDFLLLRAYASSPLQDAFIIYVFFVASFALWFCACAILLSIALTDDDIRIQGGILNWEISS